MQNILLKFCRENMRCGSGLGGRELTRRTQECSIYQCQDYSQIQRFLVLHQCVRIADSDRRSRRQCGQILIFLCLESVLRQEAEKFSAKVLRLRGLPQQIMLDGLTRILFAESETAGSCQCGRELRPLLIIKLEL